MIDTTKWEKFKIGHLFDVVRGTRLTKENRIAGHTPLVTAGAQNEGVSDFIQTSNRSLYKEVLTIDMFCNCFYHEYSFSCDDNVLVLFPKFKQNKSNALFIATIVNQEKNKYAYGRQYRQKDFNNHFLKLPSKKNNSKYEPDWEYMEQFMAPFLAEKPVTKNKYHKVDIHKWSWQKYKLSDLFEIKKGKRLTAEDQTCGTTPYIGAIDNNNGVSNHIGQSPIHKGNTISLSYNGSVGEAFYQPVDYWATDDVNALYPKFNFNKYIGLFICAVLKKEKYRFSYGRKWTLEQMNNSFIKLPSLKIQGKYTPNWNLMEGYIKSLPYGDLI